MPMKGAEQWRSRYQFQMFSWDEGQEFDDDQGEADEDKGWNWVRDVRKDNGGAKEWINSLSRGGTVGDLCPVNYEKAKEHRSPFHANTGRAFPLLISAFPQEVARMEKITSQA